VIPGMIPQNQKKMHLICIIEARGGDVRPRIDRTDAAKRVPTRRHSDDTLQLST